MRLWLKDPIAVLAVGAQSAVSSPKVTADARAPARHRYEAVTPVMALCSISARVRLTWSYW
jgi:hypothetical protein